MTPPKQGVNAGEMRAEQSDVQSALDEGRFHPAAARASRELGRLAAGSQHQHRAAAALKDEHVVASADDTPGLVHIGRDDAGAEACKGATITGVNSE